MAAADHGAKMVAQLSGKRLSELVNIDTKDGWKVAESTVQTTERLADRVSITGRGKQRMVVYFEFVMLLYPLCNHGQQPKTALTHAAKALSEKVANTLERADLLVLLGIFARLRCPKLDVHSAIGSENMKESSVYQEIAREGELLRSCASVLRVLNARFGKDETTAFEMRVNAIDDIGILETLLEETAFCRPFDVFANGCPGVTLVS